MTNTKRILLTGAGFTHNFGTPLASSIWSIIFNNVNIQISEPLRDLLINDKDFDYENIYHTVNNSDSYTLKDKEIIATAIKKAYLYIDNIVQNPSCVSTATQVENHIIKRFKSSCIFTLNQDLFVERQLHKFPDTKIILPGAASKILGKASSNDKFEEAADVSLIENKKFTKWDKVGKNRDNILYIKLHGSFDWRDKKKQSIMVIGRDKEEEIKRHSLLQSYLDKFKKILNENKIKILIIGYGFNDQHINRVLSDASNLDIYIIDPTDTRKWFEDIKKKSEFGESIIKKIRGYFPETLENIFPNNDFLNNDTVQWLTIKSAFFEDLA